MSNWLLAARLPHPRGHHHHRHVGHGLSWLGHFDDVARVILIVVLVGGGLAWVAVEVLRRRRLSWTWSLLGLPVVAIAWTVNRPAGVICGGVVGLAAWQAGAQEHKWRQAGGDLAQQARRRVGLSAVVGRTWTRRRTRKAGAVTEIRMLIGDDEHGRPVQVPVGGRSGSHTLVVGAAGAGKTTTMAMKAGRQIMAGFGCVAIDPKGDDELRDTVRHAALRGGLMFVEWSPEGDVAYNPYARGTVTELVDKLLAGEEWSEPHYLRQAQRYLGHALRTLTLLRRDTTLPAIVDACRPDRLEQLTRELSEEEARPIQAYLDGLTPDQRRDLAGVRDRLAVLAESDLAAALTPTPEGKAIDLGATIAQRVVVYFRLDSDRRPLASQMVGAAIVQDLIAICAERQADPVPTVLLVDEFSALDAGQVARLFGRGRSAGLSLLLGTQELADLAHADSTLRDQVAGNIETLIAHRQNVPDSAEFIARMAGTQGTWITTTRIGRPRKGEPLDAGTRTRGWEYVIHPDQLKRLNRGVAVVVTPTGPRARITRIHRPNW